MGKSLFFINLFHKPYFMEEQGDEKLWQLAKRRADFQNNLIGFVISTGI